MGEEDGGSHRWAYWEPPSTFTAPHTPAILMPLRSQVGGAGRGRRGSTEQRAETDGSYTKHLKTEQKRTIPRQKGDKGGQGD